MSRLAIIEITNNCNCSCKYCYESTYKNRNLYLTNDDFEKIFSYDFLYNDIVLSGGEVFTHPDWKGIFKTLIRHNKGINVISNGSYINNFIAEQIPVESMTISLDSFMAKYNMLRSNNIMCDKDDIIMLIKSKLVGKICIQVILNKISVAHENLSDIFFLRKI